MPSDTSHEMARPINEVPFTGTAALARTEVSGRSRVPRPAARISARNEVDDPPGQSAAAVRSSAESVSKTMSDSFNPNVSRCWRNRLRYESRM